MNRPNAAQTTFARRLFAHERSLSDGSGVPAAGRVYDKLFAHLAPILGDAGVQLLFVRSAKLENGEFAVLLDVPILEGAMKLRQCLHARAPALAEEAAVSFFATFFALMTTFVGARLTSEVLRRAWPTIEQSNEEKQS